MSKKPIAALVAVLSLGACASVRPGDPGVATAHWKGLTILGPLEAGLLYHERAGTDPDLRLAYAWGDVCGEPDRVARDAAVAAAGPRLKEAAGEVGEAAAWRLPLRQTLGNYDLQRGGFATPLRTGAVIRFDRNDFCRQEVLYLVAFRNGDAHALLRLSEEAAKQFIRTNPARSVVHDLEVVPVGWQPGPPGPTLLVDIVRLRTRDALSDRVLFDSALASDR
jgi:hypothetical protein